MPDWLVTTLWIVGALAVVFVVGGFLLPRKFEISRSIVVNAPPAKIHPHLDSFEKWPAWSPFDNEDPKIVWDNSGPQSGVGAKRSWKSRRMGDGSQWIVASDPANGISMKLQSMACGTEPFDIHFTFAPEAGGTRVTWTDRGMFPSAPHWRWMGFVLAPSMLGRTFEKGLKSLKGVVEGA